MCVTKSIQRRDGDVMYVTVSDTDLPVNMTIPIITNMATIRMTIHGLIIAVCPTLSCFGVIIRDTGLFCLESYNNLEKLSPPYILISLYLVFTLLIFSNASVYELLS